MEPIQASLDSILQRHFGVKPAPTNRHDQWYKRSYQSWKAEHSDREPAIIAPKTSRSEWATELHTTASTFAKAVKLEAEKIYKHRGSSSQPLQDKVFPDEVFDTPLEILGPDCRQDFPLKPAMQRASYWKTTSSKIHTERLIYYRAIRALLACEQTETLCYLATCAPSRIKHAATEESRDPGSLGLLNDGWGSMVDEMLELSMALIILKCFPDTLRLEDAYETWVPFVFVKSAATHRYATTAERLKCLLPGKGSSIALGHRADAIIEQCYRVLVATQVLVIACRASAVNWEHRFANAFLHFVGFECWNRKREGEGYLGCKLNVRKDGAWLDKMTSLKLISEGEVTKVRDKSKDPLLLREPRRDDVIGSDEEEDGAVEELARLEAQEEAYGRKRSSKYHRRHV